MRWLKRNYRKLILVLFFLLACLCADTTYTALILKIDELESSNLVNITVDCVGLLLCVILFGTVYFDRRKESTTLNFLIVIFLEGAILYCDATNWAVDGRTDMEIANTIANTGLFIIILLMIWFFWLIIRADLKFHDKEIRASSNFIFAVMVFGLALTIVNLWTGWTFTIEDGYYVRGDFILLADVPALLMFLCATVAIVRFGKNKRRKYTVVLITFIPIFATALQFMYYGLSLLYFSLILMLLVMYGNYYVSRGTDIDKLKSELTEERFSVMYSQLQPHFLYNSLSSIMNIKGNPQETIDAIADFGRYLRGNLDSLSNKHPIPIRKELEHVEIYTDLERLRFKEKLKVEFDIRDREFFVPSLTVQMLVENAIKHGISTRMKGGTVKISTFDNEKAHFIIIEDDGVGFDINKPFSSDRSHVGLTNLKNRIETQIGGELIIESIPGVGTKCTVVIPKPKTHSS